MPTSCPDVVLGSLAVLGLYNSWIWSAVAQRYCSSADWSAELAVDVYMKMSERNLFNKYIDCLSVLPKHVAFKLEGQDLLQNNASGSTSKASLGEIN